MEEQKTIKDYIVDYLLDGEDEKCLDPVLVEWLAEDESHRKEFNLYKKIWEESHRYRKYIFGNIGKTCYIRLPGLPHLC